MPWTCIGRKDGADNPGPEYLLGNFILQWFMCLIPGLRGGGGGRSGKGQGNGAGQCGVKFSQFKIWRGNCLGCMGQGYSGIVRVGKGQDSMK